jgi:hypothetical protein
MDPAAAARMSDPLMNPHFRRRWQEVAEERERRLPAHAEEAVAPRLQRLAEALLAELRRRKQQGPGGAP